MRAFETRTFEEFCEEVRSEGWEVNVTGPNDAEITKPECYGLKFNVANGELAIGMKCDNWLQGPVNLLGLSVRCQFSVSITEYALGIFWRLKVVPRVMFVGTSIDPEIVTCVARRTYSSQQDQCLRYIELIRPNFVFTMSDSVGSEGWVITGDVSTPYKTSCIKPYTDKTIKAKMWPGM